MARLLQSVARALSDHASVDWDIAHARARNQADKAMIDALRGVEILRSAKSPPSLVTHGTSRTSAVLPAWSILALALVQTAGSAALLFAAVGSLSVPQDRFPQVLLASAFGGASLFLTIYAKEGSRSLYLSAWLACAASAFAKHVLAGMAVASAEPERLLLHGIVPEAFMPACVWQFALAFPHVRRFARFDSAARLATRAAWVLGSVLFGINLVVSLGDLDAATFAPLLRDDPDRTFWHIVTVAMAPAVGAIFVRAGRAPADERRKVARLAVAIGLGTAPFLITITLSAISPRLNRWLITSSVAERFWLDAIVITALAAGPIFSSLAVIVDRPFELPAALGWLVRHAVARIAIEALVVAPFAMLAFTLYDLRDLALRGIVFAVDPWLLMACIAAAGFALFGRARVLSALDRFESRRRIEHHQQLAQVVERLRLARGGREIAAVLRRELQDGTGATTVDVLLPVPTGFAAFDDSSVTMDARLGVLLRDAPAALDVSAGSRWFGLLLPGDRTWVEAHDIAMLAAVKLRDDAVAAVLVLGPKRREAPFDDKDKRLVADIAAAAAAAWPARDDADDGNTGSRGRLHRTADEGEAAFECPSCGAVADALPLSCACGAAPQLASLPQRVGDHLLVTHRIGRGGMGIVYLARDEALDRDVALKTLPSLAPGAITRLHDEARAMAALDHPALATLFRVEMWQRTPILVVEYFPHGTLADRLARGPLAVDHAVRLGRELARALAYMHGHGVLHRDVKPSNIGMTPTGSAKLLDLGLASVIDRPYTRERNATSGPTVPAGTGAYLPPEAIDGAAPTPALDLWALAVVMLECLTGINPFAHGHHASRSRQRLAADDEVVTACLQIAPPALRPFFDRALSRDPARRFARAVEMLSALEAASAPLDMDADRISAQ